MCVKDAGVILLDTLSVFLKLLYFSEPKLPLQEVEL